MPATLYATTTQVAIAYLLHTLGQSAGVGADLPGDQATWAASGFVQAGPPHGGDVNMYAAVESPVVGLTCWACAPGGRRPPWGQAEQLAERVHRLLFDQFAGPVTVTLPSGYEQATVTTAFMLTHPARITGDDSSFAAYGSDVQLSWRGLGLT